ncbi:hypothetical protein ACFLZ7_01815 [Nanoarchaeota archaeon]
MNEGRRAGLSAGVLLVIISMISLFLPEMCYAGVGDAFQFCFNWAKANMVWLAGVMYFLAGLVLFGEHKGGKAFALLIAVTAMTWTWWDNSLSIAGSLRSFFSALLPLALVKLIIKASTEADKGKEGDKKKLSVGAGFAKWIVLIGIVFISQFSYLGLKGAIFASIILIVLLALGHIPLLGFLKWLPMIFIFAMIFIAIPVGYVQWVKNPNTWMSFGELDRTYKAIDKFPLANKLAKSFLEKKGDIISEDRIDRKYFKEITANNKQEADSQANTLVALKTELKQDEEANKDAINQIDERLRKIDAIYHNINWGT